MSRFGQLLRTFRTTRSLTQDELATRARLTVNAVGALERGERRRPYPHTVRALADALGLDDADRRTLVGSVPPAPVTSAPRGSPGPGPAAVPHRLPIPATPLFGRDDELATVVERLRSPTRRIVTLTGPGGVGKTTLAQVAAAAVREHVAAIVYVELAGVTDPRGVVAAIAAAAGVPQGGDDTAEDLAPALTGRRLLLVLDNVEHVLESAPDIAALVNACPDLVVLLTGRAALRVRHEQEIHVGPLSREAAVQLFHDRLVAAGARPDDSSSAAVDGLCARADGLPLALELSATLAARLGPAGLVDRLDQLPDAGPRDLPPRQRSMAATFAWSYELLDEPSRLLLARMSVFVGGFSLAAAHLVTDHHGALHSSDLVADDGVDTLAALAQLVDHALVLRTPSVDGIDRFRILEPLRDEALARLSPAERADAGSALAQAVLQDARELSALVQGPGQTTALDGFENGMGNLRVALDHLLAERLVDDAVELLWSVRVHLGVRGHTRDAADWVHRLRSLPMSDRSRARLATTRITLLIYQKDSHDAYTSADDALGWADRAGDRVVGAQACVVGATGAALFGDLPSARRLLERVQHDLEHDDEPAGRDWWTVLHLHVARGLTDLLRDDVDGAERHLMTGEAAARARGGDYDLALVLLCRSLVDHRRGDHAGLAAHVGEAVRFAVTAASPVLLTTLIPGLARAALDLGDVATGVRLFGAASVYNAEYDLPRGAGEHIALPVGSDLARAHELLGHEAFTATWAVGRSSTLTDIATTAARFAPRTDAEGERSDEVRI